MGWDVMLLGEKENSSLCRDLFSVRSRTSQPWAGILLPRVFSEEAAWPLSESWVGAPSGARRLRFRSRDVLRAEERRLLGGKAVVAGAGARPSPRRS